jgi:acyl-CoA hydrolase
MIKTFTLKKILEQKTSATEGKMTFVLIDETGEHREVSGVTQLDENQQAINISTHIKREHPLIQCLFDSKIDETINIEFDQYNTVIERNDNEFKTPTVEDLIKEMQEKPLRLGALLKSTEIKTTEKIH